MFYIFRFLKFLLLFVGPAVKKQWATPKETQSSVKLILS
jgi:hypothetical protein